MVVIAVSSMECVSRLLHFAISPSSDIFVRNLFLRRFSLATCLSLLRCCRAATWSADGECPAGSDTFPGDVDDDDDDTLLIGRGDTDIDSCVCGGCGIAWDDDDDDDGAKRLRL